MRSLISLAFIIFSSSLWAQDWTKSAYREPNTSYLGYKSVAETFAAMGPAVPFRVTPMESGQTGAQRVLPKATEWENEQVMMERFLAFRDLRFMTTPQKPNFMRRSSWMYPDDGCFARAALAVRNLVRANHSAPSKVFAFGDLHVQSANAIGGEVTWWYHVAPLVEVNGQKYVLDPAIEPTGPLKLEDWLARMSPRPETIEVSVCASGSYTPGDDCARETDGIEAGAESDQVWYLDLEWQRLLDLNRNPDAELGDNPPWLH